MSPSLQTKSESKVESKRWESIFDPAKRVDEANFLTEIVICNFLRMTKKPLPRSAFWQKAISEKSDVLGELRKRYGVEVAEMKNLLKVFHYGAIAQFLKSSGAVGFKLVKKETRARYLAELVDFAIKYAKAGEITASREAEAMDIPDFIEVSKPATGKVNPGIADL